ncbi:Cd(II)/Pb(II)-responsive transcriptional regulator [Polaromonas sp.]|uniref:Cd(II)/Pb(II)-responsive transcriptional regulator n=1 Tax=Polaromonas sp. TaxID=1869339 RepID=UPI003BB6B0D2
MKIGELAKLAQTQNETIRYYEREGLLPEPSRSNANYRIYGESHVQRLAFIRHCRSLDMTLGEIRTLLHFKDAPEENCGKVDALLDEHIGHVAIRIQDLRTLEKELKALRQQCRAGDAAADCGILSSLEKAAREQQHPRAASSHADHIQGTHPQLGMPLPSSDTTFQK